MKYGSRKFILTGALTVGALIGVIKGTFSGSDYALIAAAILGAYGWTSNEAKRIAAENQAES